MCVGDVVEVGIADVFTNDLLTSARSSIRKASLRAVPPCPLLMLRSASLIALRTSAVMANPSVRSCCCTALEK